MSRRSRSSLRRNSACRMQATCHVPTPVISPLNFDQSSRSMRFSRMRSGFLRPQHSSSDRSSASCGWSEVRTASRPSADLCREDRRSPMDDGRCRRCGRSECPALCRHKNTDQEARARRGLRLAHGASCTAVHTGPVDCTRGSAHHGPYWAGDKDAGTCSCSGSAHPLLCCGACGSGEGDEEGQSDFVHEGSRRTRGAEVAEGLRAIFCHSHQRQPSATLPLHRPYGSSRRGCGTGRR